MTFHAWHFTRSDRVLGYYDGRTVEPGQTLTVDREPILCRAGLHASRRITDALKYAPGPYIWRVEIGGTVLSDSDKIVGTSRTALWGFDATDLLRDYARRCALDVVHLWDAPDVVLRYLRTGDEELRDAAWAAGAAAGAAAWAAWDAARAAAWDAARAARAAARAARAARAAVRAAAWDRQNRRLTAMVCAEAHKRGLL